LASIYELFQIFFFYYYRSTKKISSAYGNAAIFGVPKMGRV